MPPRIKFVFSIVVVCAAMAGYTFQVSQGHIGPSYAALAFGLIAVVSMWIFPEVSRKKDEHDALNR
jgi:hypothetical protein